MIDFTHLPNKSLYHKVFYGTSTGATTSWQIWTKPANVSFVYMYVVGAGGAGGGGRTGGVNSGGGGGGGASSSITTALYPSFLLPEILYISVGAGSAGAPAGTGAASGALSYVSTQPSTSGIFILAQSGDVSAGGGGGGTNTGTGAGAAGTAGTVWSYTNYPLTDLGMVTSVAGQNGAAGGGNTPSSGVSITPTLTVTGGAGGGGVSVGGSPLGGGNITGSGFLPTILGGALSTSGVGGSGNHGFTGIKPTTESYMNLPMMYTGAGGGGAAGNPSGTNGGVGGNGSYGSGGGGGGASYAGTGGSGGRGGDGIVLITCW